MVVFGAHHSPHVSSSFLESSKHSYDFAGIETSQKIDDKTFITKPSEHEDEPVKTTKKSWQYICSFAVVYTMIFFNGCCFTAVAPSVPFYLQILKAPPEFLGWVVSFYSLGQIFGSPTAGWLSNDFSSKHLLLASSTMGFISSIMYALAPGYVIIMFSRLLTGISAGFEFTTELAFIANNTTVKERTAYLASVTACNVVGFIVGPALGTLLAFLDIHILGLTIDQYTGPGWLLATMFLLDLIMLQLLFKEHVLDECEGITDGGVEEPSERAKLIENIEEPDSQYGTVSADSTETNSRETASVPAQSDKHNSTNDKTVKEPPPSLLLVLNLIFVQFSLMCGFSLLETITAPLVQDEFAWTVQDCNLLFTYGGVVSLIVYVLFVVLSKWVQDRKLVFASLVLCSIGNLLAVDWIQLVWVPSWVSVLLPPYWTRFLVAFAVIYGGFMTGRPLVFALYSKLIAQQYQGEYLGWMVAGGSAARTCGPFVAVYLYYDVYGAGNNLLALFGSVGVFHIGCILLVLWQWPELLPGNPELMTLPIKNEN